MSRATQSVQDIFAGALSLRSNKASPFEIRQFITKAARDSGYNELSESGDLDEFEIEFLSTGETISFGGQELRLW